MVPAQHILADAALEGVVLSERYQVSSKLGKGGMAWVYQGSKLPSDDQIALKILFSQLSSDESFRIRFLREAQIQFQLEHKNIVRVYESFEDRGIVGFAMEWCNSGDLLHYLRQHNEQVGTPLTWDQMQPLVFPLLSALSYAHQRGVVHRDLKPQNILLHGFDDMLVPKLTDFGIAKLLDASSVTKTGSMVGTLHYMSPEQVSESKSVDWRTDIYSMGVLLYLLATLRMPFSGQSTALMLKIVQDEPEPPVEAPEPLQEVILKCLAKDPSDRYHDCESLKADLVERLGCDLSSTLNGSILTEHLTTVRPLLGDEFVSAEQSGAMQKIAPSSDSWVPPPKRSSHPTIPLGEYQPTEENTKPGLPVVFWVLVVLSLAAFGGFAILQWGSKSSHSPQTKPATLGQQKRATPRRKAPLRKRLVRPKPRKPKKPAIPDAVVTAFNKCDKENDAKACTMGGEFLLKGKPSAKKQVRARSLLKKACRGNDQQGCVRLARLMLRGIGGGKDETQGEALLSSACRLVPRLGCESLGRMWHERRIYRKARRHYRTACRKSVLTSCEMVGWFWQNGWGGRQSYYRAGTFYRQACRLGLASSCNRWGVLQAKGLFRRRGSDSAYHRLFLEACKHKHSWACFNVGMSWYQKGQDEEYVAKARDAFGLACKLGMAQGCHAVGILLWNHPKPSKASREEAKKRWQQACDGKHHPSCSTLGYIFANSSEEARDCKTASRYLKLACTLGAQPCLKCPPQRRRRRFWKRIRPQWKNVGWKQETLTP